MHTIPDLGSFKASALNRSAKDLKILRIIHDNYVELLSKEHPAEINKEHMDIIQRCLKVLDFDLKQVGKSEGTTTITGYYAGGILAILMEQFKPLGYNIIKKSIEPSAITFKYMNTFVADFWLEYWKKAPHILFGQKRVAGQLQSLNIHQLDDPGFDNLLANQSLDKVSRAISDLTHLPLIAISNDNNPDRIAGRYVTLNNRSLAAFYIARYYPYRVFIRTKTADETNRIKEAFADKKYDGKSIGITIEKNGDAIENVLLPNDLFPVFTAFEYPFLRNSNIRGASNHTSIAKEDSVEWRYGNGTPPSAHTRSRSRQRLETLTPLETPSTPLSPHKRKGVHFDMEEPTSKSSRESLGKLSIHSPVSLPRSSGRTFHFH